MQVGLMINHAWYLAGKIKCLIYQEKRTISENKGNCYGMKSSCCGLRDLIGSPRPIIITVMGAIASRITNLTIVYSTVHSGGDHRRHQSSVSLTFVRGIHRWPVNSPHKWPVTRKMFPFDDVIMMFFKILYIPTASRRDKSFNGANSLDIL